MCDGEKMKHIKQLDRKGCAVACLAMLLGYDYYKMRSLIDKMGGQLCNWGKKPDPSRGFVLGLYPHEMLQIIKTLRPKVKSNCVKWKESLSKAIIVVVPINTYMTTHAVFYDGKMIYDPGEDKPITPRKYFKDKNILNVIEFTKVKK